MGEGAEPVSARAPRLRARTLGALAVAGVVVAFSLSSTLVKRAETPGGYAPSVVGSRYVLGAAGQ